jgi:hypothetical protein
MFYLFCEPCKELNLVFRPRIWKLYGVGVVVDSVAGPEVCGDQHSGGETVIRA